MKRLSFLIISIFYIATCFGQTKTNKIESTGNVGIGTTDPETNLHVNKQNVGIKTNHSLGIYEAKDCHIDLLSSPADTWGSSLNFVEGNGNQNVDIWSIIRQTTNGGGNSSLNFKFGQSNDCYNNSTKLTLLGNGNFGIGTIKPSEKLEIHGSVRILNQGTGYRKGLFLFTNSLEDGNNTGIDFSTSNNIDYIGARIEAERVNGGYSNLNFKTLKKGDTTNNPSSSLYIKWSGNVGIGLTSPKAKLHIASYNTHTTGIYEGYGDLLLYNHQKSAAELGAILTFGSHYEDNSGTGFSTRAAIKGGTSISGNTGAGYLAFFTVPRGYANKNTERMRIDHEGNVGIGKVASKDIKLDVCGTIRAKEVKVENFTCSNGSFNGNLAANNITYTANGQTADFVFEENYHLKDLSEVENYIKEHKHLEGIASAKEMEEQGVNLAEMNKLLLQKIEELTLHTIAQEKKLKEKDIEVESLEERLVKIEKLLLNGE